MNPIRVTLRRTISLLLNYYTTAIIISLFFIASATLFAINLEFAEGGALPLAVIWASSIAPILPFLSTLLAMDSWSSERASGRLDLLLSSPVRERDLVFGKFFGLWLTQLFLIATFHLATMIFLAIFAPQIWANVPFWSFAPGFFALAIQCATWTAVATASSALCRRAGVAAILSTFILVAIPRGLWFALLSWAPQGRTVFGEMPFDAHVCDIASGLFPFATLISYLLAILLALFIASKTIAATRLIGRDSKMSRFTTFLVIFIASASLISCSTLAKRLDFVLDIPVGFASKFELSSRLRHALADTRGDLTITLFLSRKDQNFRSTARFLRALEKASDANGGARIFVRYVDPNWDLGAAERLVQSGAKPGDVVFSLAHRTALLSIADGINEQACLSTVHRLASPPQRSTVYWSTGHGETSFLSYDNFGLSSIARDIARDGYRNRELNLAVADNIPTDCALIIIAGAKTDFSRIEAARLDAYLRQGGRMLVLLANTESGGIAPLLSRWGIRPSVATFQNSRTLSGSDVIASASENHTISSQLSDAQIIFEKPLSFAPSAAVETGSGADKIEFTALAKVDEHCVAAITERGIGAGEDLMIRPMRLIALGDTGLVINSALTSRANANRDFFLNCIAYLAGTDAVNESSITPDRLISGMDRQTRMNFLIASAGAFPGGFFIFLLAIIAFRRRR